MQGRSPSTARSPPLGFARGPLHGSALRALPCRVPVLNPNAGSLQLRDASIFNIVPMISKNCKISTFLAQNLLFVFFSSKFKNSKFQNFGVKFLKFQNFQNFGHKVLLVFQNLKISKFQNLRGDPNIEWIKRTTCYSFSLLYQGHCQCASEPVCWSASTRATAQPECQQRP